MKVVTCISDEENWWYNNILAPSCRHFNLELITLLFKKEYWITHRNKDLLLVEYLENIDPSEIILFTDGYDTLFLSGEDEILRKFRSFKKPVVFTAEKNCWPDISLRNRYPRSPTNSRYINSGGFIGYAGVIRRLIKSYEYPPIKNFTRKNFFWEMKKRIFKREFNPALKYYFSNQYYWTKVFLYNQEVIALDYFSILFQELTTPRVRFSPDKIVKLSAIPTEIQIEQDKRRVLEIFSIGESGFQNRITGAKPCQLHFNGHIIKQLIHDPAFRGITPWRSSSEDKP